MFTRTQKPKQGSPDQESVHDKQNYDFSKMRMAAVSQRKPREDGEKGEKGEEESEEKKQEIHEKPKEKRPVRMPFIVKGPVAKSTTGDEDEDGFTVVKANKRVTKP